MSSFGGETPVNSVTSITSVTTGTKYTVPAGRYAVLEGFAYISGADTLTVGGVVLSTSTLGPNGQSLKFRLSSGETVSVLSSGGVLDYHLGITEFNNP